MYTSDHARDRIQERCGINKARHIDEELEEQMTMETVVKSVAVDDINGDLILLAEVA